MGIAYRSGYKYQLSRDYEVQIDGILGEVASQFIRLSVEGVLVIKSGYAWDGPSGPTKDTPDFMRGSLVHDAIYQLIREGLLPESDRKRADEILYEICREDGMSWARAQWVYWAVRAFGRSSADPMQKREIREAP